MVDEESTEDSIRLFFNHMILRLEVGIRLGTAPNCFASEGGVGLFLGIASFQPAWISGHMDVSGTIGAILNQKSREIFSISPDATVFEAIEMMDKKNVGALLVMERRAIDRNHFRARLHPQNYAARQAFPGNQSRRDHVNQCDRQRIRVSRVEKCLRLMTDKHIRHLPVLEGDKVVGVISIGDLVKQVISCQQSRHRASGELHPRRIAAG